MAPGANGNLNQRNNQIRQYCQANNKVLFDFADIESYDPDGLTNYMALNANDNCDYDNNGVSRNWATEWQASHTQNVDWYNCSCAHSQSLNGNQKAYAAWALWTDLATPIWNGPGGGNYGLAASWTNKTVPNGVNEIARFSGGITAPSTVTLDSAATLGMLKFDSSQSYTLAGSGSLTLQTTSGDATINVNAGSHTINVPVVINSNTVIRGAGSLEFIRRHQRKSYLDRPRQSHRHKHSSRYADHQRCRSYGRARAVRLRPPRHGRLWITRLAPAAEP